MSLIENQSLFARDRHARRAIPEITAEAFDSDAGYLKMCAEECCLVIFYKPHCPYCIQAAPLFTKVASMCPFAEFKAVNYYECGNQQLIETMNKTFSESQAAVKTIEPDPSTFLIKTFPTILLFKKGHPVEKFEGERTEEKLIALAKKCCDGGESCAFP